MIANSRPPDSLLTQGSPNQSDEITTGRTEPQHTTVTNNDAQTQGTDEANSSLREGTRTSLDAESRDAIVPNNGRTPNSGKVPQADENNSTFEHRLGHQPYASVPCAQDNNFTGEDNHSACEIPNNIHPTQTAESAEGNSSWQPDQSGKQQPVANLSEGNQTHDRRDAISPTVQFTNPSSLSVDRDVQACQSDPTMISFQPARRPLTGKRIEPIARRMRTTEPPQHEEQPETAAATWGLGPRSANERWDICDQYIQENGNRETRSGLNSAPTTAGCPANSAVIAIGTWLQAGFTFPTMGSISDQGHRTTGTASESVNHRIRATDAHKLRRNSSLCYPFSTGQDSRGSPLTKQ